MSKKHREKLMAGCLLLVLTVFLSACGGEEKTAETTTEGREEISGH